jgi:hypothetical protein
VFKFWKDVGDNLIALAALSGIKKRGNPDIGMIKQELDKHFARMPGLSYYTNVNNH